MRIMQIWRYEEIFVSLCNDWRQRTSVKARSTLFTGLGTMLFDDAAPERVAGTTYISGRMKGIREHYENVAVGGGRNRQPSTIDLRKRCSTGLNSSVSGN